MILPLQRSQIKSSLRLRSALAFALAFQLATGGLRAGPGRAEVCSLASTVGSAALAGVVATPLGGLIAFLAVGTVEAGLAIAGAAGPGGGDPPDVVNYAVRSNPPLLAPTFPPDPTASSDLNRAASNLIFSLSIVVQQSKGAFESRDRLGGAQLVGSPTDVANQARWLQEYYQQLHAALVATKSSLSNYRLLLSEEFPEFCSFPIPPDWIIAMRNQEASGNFPPSEQTVINLWSLTPDELRQVTARISRVADEMILEAGETTLEEALSCLESTIDQPFAAHLGIQPTAGGVQLSWPLTDTSFSLQTTTHVKSGNWTEITTPPSLNRNFQYVVSQPAAPGMRFYRLVGKSTDLVSPTLISAIPDPRNDRITLTFSEPVDQLSATDLLNYYLADTEFNLIFPIAAILATPQSVDLLIDPPLTPGGNYHLGVEGVRDLAGNVMLPVTLEVAATDIQVPCPGGTLLVRQVYSECIGGVWHIIEDDWYSCPPDGSVQKFRVSDKATTEPCARAQAPLDPTSVIGVNQNPCPNPVFDGTVIIMKCNGGAWEEWTYPLVRCPDGSIRVNPLPIQVQVANPLTPCNQPPPPPSGAR